MDVYLSADCWCCGRLTFYGQPHRSFCWAEGDGRYFTDDRDRWPGELSVVGP